MKVSDHLFLRVGLAHFQARFTNIPDKLSLWEPVLQGLSRFSLYRNIPFKPRGFDVPDNTLEPHRIIAGYMWSWLRDE